jgi:predicted transcriptional regulator
MLEHAGKSGVSAVRQQSVERFVRRFKREIDEPEDIDERHIVLRRVVINKMRQISEIMRQWKSAASEETVDE